MRKWIAILVATLALLLVLAEATEASWYETRVTQTPLPSTEPRVTFDAWADLHVFWEEGGQILHRAHTGLGWEDVEVVGTGGDFDISTCPVCNLIHVAWVSDAGRIRYRKWDNGVWLSAEDVPWGGTGSASRPSVTNFGEGQLVWGEFETGSAQLRVYYSWRDVGGWTPALELAGPISWWWPESPSVNIQTVDVDGRLLVTWLEEDAVEPGLYGRLWNLEEWEPAQLCFDSFGVRTAAGENVPGGQVHFASNGLQPACPCNVVLYASGTPDAWNPVEEIGSGHTGAEWEWPQQVSLRVTSTNTPHVVWRHESYDFGLNLIDERLMYAVKHGDQWAFDGQIAIDRNARDPDVYTDPAESPAVVWSDDSSGSFDIYLVTRQPLSAVPGDAVAAPGRIATLFPNPTRGATEIRLASPLGGEDRIRVYDAQSRLVAMFGGAADGHLDATSFRWDGTDRWGRPLPAGVYRVRIGSGSVARPLVIVR